MIPLSIADIAEITGGSLDCVSDPDPVSYTHLTLPTIYSV